MSSNYFEWRKHQNIRPLKLKNKEKFYSDIINIEHSWSGRMDTNVGNTFIMEAEQQLINAIELYELGYFDCAYYSLRSAIDLSTTMVFLCDLPDNDRGKYLKDWKNIEDFPLRGTMIAKLKKANNVFCDMYDKMPNFFNRAHVLSSRLNKFVHKQGLVQFYVSRNHPIYGNKSDINFIEDFESDLKECIAVVAVMRLAIDPFPVLLMDEEILYRCFDSLTEPYSENFVSEYIGKDIIEEYKTTDIYRGTYKSFENEEKKNQTVFDIMKHQYINTTKKDDIFAQLHLLPIHNIISTVIALSCDKVVKVYTMDGLLMYFTDKNTNRTKHSWSGADFKKFQEPIEKINQPYDEAFISVFNFDNEYYFAEHNELLDQDDVTNINEYTHQVMLKYNVQ